ncbi:hypothetical protein ACQ676_003417 [Vibrio fluvialis]|uniref:hypothetical protein n=1 Tax=Vibrio fluvialis TaxID=676 RepID=UPI00399A3209
MKDSNLTIGYIVLGKGNIATRWIELFFKRRRFILEEFNVDSKIICIANSRNVWKNIDGVFSDDLESDFSKHSNEYNNVVGLLSEICSAYKGELVVLDLTSSEEVANSYTDIADFGCHLITANKIVESTYSRSYQTVVDAFKRNNIYFLRNATVGAGLPINYAIQSMIECGDQITGIEGVFSGTLSWLFESYNGELSFSELVKIAQKQGITESDPRVDLSGNDVKRKLIILARNAGFNLEPENVKVESLIGVPDTLCSLDEFYRKAQSLNEFIEEKYIQAKSKGCSLKYVAKFSDNMASVGLEAVSDSSPMASIFPCDNIFIIRSLWYQDNPLVIRGPGAGRDVTAGAVQADVMFLSKAVSKQRN